ncbi:MAG: serine/threonine-protein kinase [Gemmatimonadales bacterium]
MRRAWVQATEPDLAIRNQVLSLLDAAGHQGILDAPIPAAILTPEPAAEMAQRLATILGQRYRIERVLGEGGMATVYLAHEEKHDRPVVLKVLRPEVAQWIGAARFLDEIRIVARLSHPHIIALIDSGEIDGLLYYVMPYHEGETLRQRLDRGPLPTGVAMTVIRDIALALGHAHAAGFVHRDLKPDNILLVDGHAFLMDFGVAKLTNRSSPTETMEGMAIGTLPYMAPEQAVGREVDARADVYAWGLVAREVLGPAAERSLIAPLIRSALSSDQAGRPADGSAILSALNRLTRQRRRFVRAALAVGISAALAVSAGLIWQLRMAPIQLDPEAGPVAVTPLRNETGDTTLAVWGRLAGDWLTQGLQETGRAAVIPWPVALEATRTDSASSASDAVAAATGAGSIVTGSYYLIGNRLRFQAELSDRRTGTAVATVVVNDVHRDSAETGVRLLRDRLMGMLALRTDDRLDRPGGAIPRPPTYRAYQLFERGLEAHNRQDYQRAAADLLSAWQEDTTFQQTLAYAGRALWNAGERDRVDSLIRSIRARKMSLGAYDEYQIRYLEHQLAGDGLGALRAIREAAALAPGGRAEYNVALTAISVGRPGEAAQVLERIDPDAGAFRGWAPYWFVLGHTLHLQGRYREEVAAARELRRRHPDSRAGWVHLTRALASEGDTTALDSLLVEASTLPPDTYWSQGAMMVTAGEELQAHGFAQQAARYFAMAERWLANQLARTPDHRAHRFWLGSARYDQGAWHDAQPYFESLTRDFPDDFQFRGLAGVTAARLGDSARAEQLIGPPPPYVRGGYLVYRARLAAIAGDTERAMALWSEAVGAGLNGIAWIHASTGQDLRPLAGDPRLVRLGLVPPRSRATRYAAIFRPHGSESRQHRRRPPRRNYSRIPVER